MMILCSETRTIQEIQDVELKINGYNMIRCDSHNRQTGGVVAYIRKGIKVSIIDTKAVQNNTWYITYDVNSGPLKGRYCIMYH